MSQDIGSATYIRLSKIERGEIFARADELKEIGKALDVDPSSLLIDVDESGFDIAAWAFEFQNPGNFDQDADNLAVLLAAAIRARRAADSKLTIAALEADYGIAPVILSRIENAYKPLDRWSHAVKCSLFDIFNVADAEALKAYLRSAHATGELDAMLPLVANPTARITKTRAKVNALRAELAGKVDAPMSSPQEKAERPQLDPPKSPAPDADAGEAMLATDRAIVRLVPVFGAPLGDGLIALTATGTQVEAPRDAGPRAYGLRVCRPTLGSGLPGRSTLVVDPDRFPSAGGLAVLRETDGLRILSITSDRQGRMFGHSEYPNREIAIDEIDPEDLATVLSAQFE